MVRKAKVCVKNGTVQLWKNGKKFQPNEKKTDVIFLNKNVGWASEKDEQKNFRYLRVHLEEILSFKNFIERVPRKRAI